MSTYNEVCRVISEYKVDTISKFIIRGVDRVWFKKSLRYLKNHDFALAFIFALVITRDCLSGLVT